MKHIRSVCILFIVSVLFFNNSSAQKPVTKKYPSLFWEITGNGLNKPSYLFGTMHVSSKMVFHLSDLFYHALKNVDVVALELNPEKWQGDMFKLQQSQANLTRFSSAEMADYINEQSFQLTKYEDNLKRALIEEPTVVNSLLYRSYQSRADFEENTYLDLYIYQTGRKLGKIPSGVEDYEETEKLMMEAYQDMAKEKARRTINTDGESMQDIDVKMQEAYRKGDLDLMDSLEVITITSPAFTEKFLYKRNEIQANSIDTILQKQSLFVGVGAAHLPGTRGVIELLRNKGYKLRPIFMQNRDAQQKEAVDKLRVPVNFSAYTSDDGLINMQLPGKLFVRPEARLNDSWQYADMNNGSYYMLTRVRHHGAMLGETEKQVFRKVDSMLYENIPGKILKKTLINKNGYSGYDIVNKTRRGDIQRYNIIVTPFEVLIFKMSGTDNYVEGKEAETFFNSITLVKKAADGWQKFEPKQGGFSVQLPHTPNQVLHKKSTDRLDRWEYEAFDEATGSAYMVWKKSVYNINFLEEDTFDLSLVEESLKKSDIISKQLYRKFGKQNGVPFVEAVYALKNGQQLSARAVIKGPHYYLLAARGNNKSNNFSKFFQSFSFTDFKYSSPEYYEDTILNIQVKTAVQPDIDHSLRAILNKASGDEFASSPQALYDYWPKSKSGLFKSEATGEAIWVSVETFPKYYYSKDSAKFWRERFDERKLVKDMVLERKTFNQIDAATAGYTIVLKDTNSSRSIQFRYLLKDNALFRFATVTDTANVGSSFIQSFFETAKPVDKSLGTSVFENKLNRFYADFNSSDSLIKKRANSAIPNMYFGKEGFQWLTNAINNLKYEDKDYFDLKSRMINELGYIDDTCCNNQIVQNLKALYQKTSDTSIFQNAIFSALARLKTKESFNALKDLMLQDPPVFDNTYEYARLFNYLDDSLALAKLLFPDMLQLAQIDDYKLRLNSLLSRLVDSGYVNGKDYETYFSKLMFDAKVQLKKQQARDERIDRQTRQEEDERFTRSYGTQSLSSNLDDYMALLIPFYDRNEGVQQFYQKLLQSKDVNVQMEALSTLLKNNKPVPDTLFNYLAAKDAYRVKLLAALEKVNRVDLFPAKYKKQQDIALSLLLSSRANTKVAQVEMVDKKYMEYKEKKGYVYFFKFKLKADSDWQMAISGLQPLNVAQVSSADDLVRMTDRRLRADEPAMDQFENQLRRMIYGAHKSSRQFFTGSGYRGF